MILLCLFSKNRHMKSTPLLYSRFIWSILHLTACCITNFSIFPHISFKCIYYKLCHSFKCTAKWVYTTLEKHQRRFPFWTPTVPSHATTQQRYSNVHTSLVWVTVSQGCRGHSTPESLQRWAGTWVNSPDLITVP